MKLFLTIIAVMFFIMPTHNLRAQGTHYLSIDNEIPYSLYYIKFRSTRPANTVQSNLYPQTREQSLSHVPLIERIVAQQKNVSRAFLNKQAQLNSGLNKTASPNSQIYLPDSLTLYSMTDTILITASYDQKGSTTQRLVKVWVSGHWANYMLDTWTYFGANDNSIDLEQMWLNGQWVNSTLDSSTFDAKGNMLVHLFSYWSGGVRKDSILSSRTYDANGGMLTDLAEYMTNGQWANHDRSTYTNDGSGNHLTWLYETWTNSKWTYSDQYAYTYYGNGDLHTSLWQYWQNSQWNNGTLDTYAYNGNGKLSTLVVQSWSGSWTNASKSTHTYDANGYETIWLMQNWSGVLWVNLSQFDYTNNSNGKVLTSLYRNWQNSTWTNYQQSTFTYDANGNEITGYNTQWSSSSWKPVDYNFDVNINGSDYYFYGYAINLSYIRVTTGVSADNNSIIKGYSLSQNYPNPFNPNTTISYQLPTQSHVTLRVFDVLGREVAVLVNGIEQPGYKSVNFNAKGLASGVYLYSLQTDRYLANKTLLLLK
jgi:hypothetical protein